MCRHSEENDTMCLGIFDVSVRKFPNVSEKVPQNGWNSIENLSSPLFSGIKEGAYVYYNNSYYAEADPQAIATTTYVLPFSGALHRDNFYAVQFHPEKSWRCGRDDFAEFFKPLNQRHANHSSQYTRLVANAFDLRKATLPAKKPTTTIRLK